MQSLYYICVYHEKQDLPKTERFQVQWYSNAETHRLHLFASMPQMGNNNTVNAVDHVDTSLSRRSSMVLYLDTWWAAVWLGAGVGKRGSHKHWSHSWSLTEVKSSYFIPFNLVLHMSVKISGEKDGKSGIQLHHPRRWNSRFLFLLLQQGN
jgi:hypothetical protein